MQPTIWKNANGTWSHRYDAECEWQDETACRTDYQFHQEWRR